MNRTRTLASAAALLTAFALALTGCSSPSEPEAVEESSAPAEVWPRTVEIPAGAQSSATTLTIEEAPQRIAALDYESAEVLAELGLADRVVLVPEAVLNPALGGHVAELGDVEETFPVAMEIDAETVLALEPDLVVMSPRHGNEAPIAEVLQQSGVSALQLPDPWASTAALLVNIDLLGQATGADADAEALAAEIEDGITAAGAEAPSSESPRVLVLTNQAGRPFVTAGEAYPIELLELAGAQNAAEDIGIDRTGPISAEQVIQADPDGIVLIDMNGTGDRMYAELLANPAVAAVPAIADERVLRVEGRDVQALGLTATIDGLAGLTEWVGTL